MLNYVLITSEDFLAITKAFRKSPVAHVKKMINKKFTFTLLLHIWFLKQNKFGELITIRNMNSKTLTYTLRDMTKNELIRKKTYQKSPKITKYFITKKGKALVQIYIHMINFSMKYYGKNILVNEKSQRIEDLFSKEMLEKIQSI